MSPMLNSPSRAWSAKSGNRVRNVAPCHIGLAGRTVDGIPTTGIDPALVSVTRAFIPSPQSISSTPVRAKGDRTRRNTSHRIAGLTQPDRGMFHPHFNPSDDQQILLGIGSGFFDSYHFVKPDEYCEYDSVMFNKYDDGWRAQSL